MPHYTNSYSTTCQKLLLSVCEELLLPVPAELSGSPVSMSPHETSVENSPNSAICDQTSDQHSLPCEISTTVSMNTRRLVPFLSYMARMVYCVYYNVNS